MQLNRNHLRIISIGLFVLAILAIFQDKIGIKIDATVVILVGLAVLIFILPELSNLSKFKYGDIELEFEKKVDKLEKLVVAEETTNSSFRGPLPFEEATKTDWQYYYSEYRDILNSNISNIEKILRAAQLVEVMITVAGKDFNLLNENRSKYPSLIMNELYNQKLISEEEMALYNEFYSLRNKIIHGQIKDISDSLTARILDLLWRIVRIFG